MTAQTCDFLTPPHKQRHKEYYVLRVHYILCMFVCTVCCTKNMVPAGTGNLLLVLYGSIVQVGTAGTTLLARYRTYVL